MFSNPNFSFWRGKKVLVTGHTGFKGSWLSFLLNQLNCDVNGISLPPVSDFNLFSQLNLIEKINTNMFIDIASTPLSNTLTPDYDVVFHMAAQPLVRESYRSPVSTWQTNVMGTLNLLQFLLKSSKPCAVVVVTTDKVYENNENHYAYTESDKLGGWDPYSSSKAAVEILVESWRRSFCGTQKHQNPYLLISTARAGNVIGGGDWSQDRLIPDVVRSLIAGKIINIRNPKYIRPWQHVLEPLTGYLILAEALLSDSQTPISTSKFTTSFNFGPLNDPSNSVNELLDCFFKYWSGTWTDVSDKQSFHEASTLQLNIDKAVNLLHWSPRWSFNYTVERTSMWYKNVMLRGHAATTCCLNDISNYFSIDSF
ncbi:CDP-glucose 4,6-dehydratase [Prochlorococcus marinus str. MIT 1342]|uniref:CDP-glucose 4,6-dehydratase n=1 Tax=Prochlorococcus TaxID=1218 RepID=UPI0007B33613|nr:CDP-glucose 4,6-dehydratase [Prochlorococcus marinus]KZR79919.1 CDP-glucose 4,6-dehydratase [Prochlorococcus marinus str. MIT 1342]